MQIPISRRRLCALLPLFPAAKLLFAQQSTPAAASSPTFTTGVNVVNLFAIVRDKPEFEQILAAEHKVL